MLHNRRDFPEPRILQRDVKSKLAAITVPGEARPAGPETTGEAGLDVVHRDRVVVDLNCEYGLAEGKLQEREIAGGPAIQVQRAVLAAGCRRTIKPRTEFDL